MRLFLPVSIVIVVLAHSAARAQDIPGIEICTAEKTMERRTSCLQSNVDFLQKTITRLQLDHQQKLDGANRQIEALKAYALAQQKGIEELKAAQAKLADDLKKKADAPATKDAPAAGAKDGAKDAAKDAAK
jgi:TolA-binding protein